MYNRKAVVSKKIPKVSLNYDNKWKPSQNKIMCGASVTANAEPMTPPEIVQRIANMMDERLPAYARCASRTDNMTIQEVKERIKKTLDGMPPI